MQKSRKLSKKCLAKKTEKVPNKFQKSGKVSKRKNYKIR